MTTCGHGFGFGGSYKISDNYTLMAQYMRVDGDIDMPYVSNGYAIDSNNSVSFFDKSQ